MIQAECKDDYIAELLDTVPAWHLAQALSKRIEQCPSQGQRGQMKALLGQFYTAGGPWLYGEGIKE